MNLSVNFIDDEIYKKIYYIYIFMKLRASFYQSRGFVVSPTATLKNNAEVVFPLTPMLKNRREELENICKILEPSFLHSFFVDPKEVADFDLSDITIAPTSYNKDVLLEKLLANQILTKFFDFVKVDLPINLNIFPITFGTSCTFTINAAQDSLDIFVTYRHDIPSLHLIGGIVGAVVVFKTGEHASPKDEMYRPKEYWVKRQFLTDFINTNTIISDLMSPNNSYNGTLDSIKVLEQHANIYKTSKKYLIDLGLEYEIKLKFEKGSVIIDDKKIPLTRIEAKLLKCLHHNLHNVCDFEYIAQNLWGDDTDKYSEAALAKHISNVRLKFKDVGFSNNVIHSSRGRGFLLTI